MKKRKDSTRGLIAKGNEKKEMVQFRLNFAYNKIKQEKEASQLF